MKNLPVLLVFVLISITSFSQTEIRENRHVFIFDISLNQCQFDGCKITPVISRVIERGWKFRVRNVVDDGKNYVIQISEFTSKTPETKIQNALTFKNSNFENIYFKLSEIEYKAFAEELKRRGSFVVGASTTLVKIRPGNGSDNEDDVIYSEFGNDFNIGLTAGWRITDYEESKSVSVVGGISLSSIKVTPQTTRNFIDSEATQSAITFSGGLIFEIEKFQLSTFVGIDTMSGEIGKNWIYRNRPWIGLGFGYEIFKPKGKDDNKEP
ncbi:hypothetical protein ACFFVB_13015 [Formosa undariae]|uniref:DUF481 domain-containing protein n=1 Tax=Formosa undariae TaxID=1325436 RepID=A0ABV5F3H3_9FLAO